MLAEFDVFYILVLEEGQLKKENNEIGVRGATEVIWLEKAVLKLLGAREWIIG